VSGSSTRHDWATALLQACAGRRRARTDRCWLGQALSIFWPAISRGSSTVARSDSMPADVVASETSVEVVLPEGRGCLQLCCSSWSWVVGVDAVGGPPHVDFTNDGEVRPAARWRPHRLRIVLAGATSDPIREVGH
jgi:hypothetical protein